MLKSRLLDALRQMPSRKYGKKSWLWCEGEAFNGLWLITSGAIKTFRITPDGEEQVTGVYLPGEYLGLDELPGELHRGYAQVMDDCAAQRLSPLQLSELMDTGDVRSQVYQLMSEHLCLNKARFYQLSSLSAGERLAHFIDDLASRSGFPGCALREFRLPMPRCDIANYLGLTPETVTRELIRLEQAGVLASRLRVITILQPAHLKQRAGC